MDQARLEFQRNFYHLLLDLAAERIGLSESLSSALQLIANVTDAEKAYLEVRDTEEHLIYRTKGIDSVELEEIQNAISSGIIAEAIKTREILLVPSALIDPRFASQKSVQDNAIETVLCVPFFGSSTHGVLYLQGDRGFKEEAEKIQIDTELFAQHVSPLLDRLLIEQERKSLPIEALRSQYDLNNMVGASPLFVEMVQSALAIAPMEVNTLLLGETGTGKTQLAELIHNNSERKQQPFVAINCAALPDTLVESELFGAMAGAHSSATRNITGKIATAENGTLFLDEVGELPLESQAKLLQFIESGQYYPLGSSKVHTSDARLIFATNRDLVTMIQKGEFREDLYHRINTFELTLPTLLQRKTDIGLLLKHFVEQAALKNKLAKLTVSPDLVNHLSSHIVPGNIRGLQNLVEQASVRAVVKGDSELNATHFPPLNPAAETNTPDDFHAATLSFQEQLLTEKLASTRWNISQTARELNLSRSHVHNLINQFDLTRH